MVYVFVLFIPGMLAGLLCIFVLLAGHLFMDMLDVIRGADEPPANS